MSRRSYPRNTLVANVRRFLYLTPWKLLLLLPILVILAIPTYLYASRFGGHMLPSMTQLFYNISGPAAPPTPTPHPTLPSTLPQTGSILYTVQSGDSCDSILTFQMRMSHAGQVFSDVNAPTVNALNQTLGHDCHDLQPGIVMPLSPQYPLVALGGLVLKIEGAGPQPILPTPLIHVTDQAEKTPDCSDGCVLTTRIAPSVTVKLQVQTTLPIHIGSWVWAQAMLARKQIANFDNYPYADPKASFNGMLLHACDFQVDDAHDNNSLSCDQITPNTIDDDGGAWLFGVAGPSALDHWHYHLPVSAGTHVLIWLSADNNGNLSFSSGNPIYRYDNATHVYVGV